MQGASYIPELRLTRLNKLIERFKTSPDLKLTNMFPEDKWESDNIEWEGQNGSRGLAPFASEDAEAPMTSPLGKSDHKAKAAFWKEKDYLGSSFMNNIREPGNPLRHYSAQKQLARMALNLNNRSDRRKEWMLAKMLTDGGFDYMDKNQQKISVDYGVPAGNKITLASNRQWNTDTANIVEDLMDLILTARNNGISVDHAMFTSEILKDMISNKHIQTLLSKSNFGAGDLFARPIAVLSALLEVKNLMLYDEQYQVSADITTALSAGAGPHTIYIDDTRDFEVGDSVTLYDVDAITKEVVVVTAINHQLGTLTATGTITGNYKAGEDVVSTTKKFIPTNKFILFASKVEGQKIAEFCSAPFGNERKWGRYMDKKEIWDPDGVFLRVQNKGLPVLYFEDAVWIYTVK